VLGLNLDLLCTAFARAGHYDSELMRLLCQEVSYSGLESHVRSWSTAGIIAREAQWLGSLNRPAAVIPFTDSFSSNRLAMLLMLLQAAAVASSLDPGTLASIVCAMHELQHYDK
jgi:hypothetical protein